MSLTKANLINSICNQCGLSKHISTNIVESLIEIIKSTLESGEDVLISGFSNFCVKDKNQRRGRNIQTGDDLMLDARRVVIFRCSTVLRKNKQGGVKTQANYHEKLIIN